LRRGITPEINAISTLMLLFSILTILIWYRLRTRSPRGEEKLPDVVLAVAGTGEPA
jgi:ABC-type spermidine/putrescine transport system permease subunit II